MSEITEQNAREQQIGRASTKLPIVAESPNGPCARPLDGMGSFTRRQIEQGVVKEYQVPPKVSGIAPTDDHLARHEEVLADQV